MTEQTTDYHRYVLGNSATKWSLTRGRQWRIRFPWQRPRGGWRIGPFCVWWTYSEPPSNAPAADVLSFTGTPTRKDNQ